MGGHTPKLRGHSIQVSGMHSKKLIFVIMSGQHIPLGAATQWPMEVGMARTLGVRRGERNLNKAEKVGEIFHMETERMDGGDVSHGDREDGWGDVSHGDREDGWGRCFTWRQRGWMGEIFHMETERMDGGDVSHGDREDGWGRYFTWRQRGWMGEIFHMADREDGWGRCFTWQTERMREIEREMGD